MKIPEKTQCDLCKSTDNPCEVVCVTHNGVPKDLDLCNFCDAFIMKSLEEMKPDHEIHGVAFSLEALNVFISRNSLGGRAKITF